MRFAEPKALLLTQFTDEKRVSDLAGIGRRHASAVFSPPLRFSAQVEGGAFGDEALLLGRFFRRDFRVARRGLLQIGLDAGVDIAKRPADSSAEQVQEKLVPP